MCVCVCVRERESFVITTVGDGDLKVGNGMGLTLKLEGLKDSMDVNFGMVAKRIPLFPPEVSPLVCEVLVRALVKLDKPV